MSADCRDTPPDRLPRLYTVRDTAAYAQVSAKTVRRWLKTGVLPFHLLGRQIRIAEADLLAFSPTGGKDDPSVRYRPLQ